MRNFKLTLSFTFLISFSAYQSGFAADTFRDCDDCPEMVRVPAGVFTMGSKTYGSEMPPTPIVIAKNFAIGKYEVTFKNWAACVKDDGCQSNPAPSDHKWGKGTRPVIYVTWHHTQDFLRWLNHKVEGNPYRLLSEAEWEYAARADRDGKNTTEYSWGNSINCNLANYGRRRGSLCFDHQMEEHGKTRRVGSYSANPFGLHDMHGNVWEWVEDCWHNSFQELPTKVKNNGAAWTDGDCVFRVIRGGSWINEPGRLRSSNRSRLGAANRDLNFGFRVARSLP